MVRLHGGGEQAERQDRSCPVPHVSSPPSRCRIRLPHAAWDEQRRVTNAQFGSTFAGPNRWTQCPFCQERPFRLVKVDVTRLTAGSRRGTDEAIAIALRQRFGRFRHSNRREGLA